MALPDPLIVEVSRGAMVESRHRVSFAVVDGTGRVVMGGGDPEALVYGRSALKPLQALPMLESGAADAFGLGPAEIAMACASHRAKRAMWRWWRPGSTVWTLVKKTWSWAPTCLMTKRPWWPC